MPGHLLCEQRAGVLGVGQCVAVDRRGVHPGVARHDDDVGAGGLHPRHHDLRLLDDAGEAHLALDVGGVPDRHAGGDQAEDADRHRLLAAHLDPLEHVRREDRCAGVPVDRVRRQQREVALPLERAQRVEPVVVLVVAQRRGVVADRVHRGGHRVLRAGGDRVDLGEVVGQRRALDGVPRVEREAVVGTALGAHRLDERRGLRDADLVALAVAVGGVAEVVPVVDVAVQVGGAENGEPEVARPVGVPVRAVVRAGGLRVGGGEEPGAADRGHGEQLSAGGGGERVRVGVGHDRRP